MAQQIHHADTIARTLLGGVLQQQLRDRNVDTPGGGGPGLVLPVVEPPHDSGGNEGQERASRPPLRESPPTSHGREAPRKRYKGENEIFAF